MLRNSIQGFRYFFSRRLIETVSCVSHDVLIAPNSNPKSTIKTQYNIKSQVSLNIFHELEPPKRQNPIHLSRSFQSRVFATGYKWRPQAASGTRT